MSQTQAPAAFRVALTADCYAPDGSLKFKDLGLDVFTAHPHVRPTRFGEHRPAIGADQVADAQGVMVLTPAVTKESVSRGRDLLAIGRLGVGYDAVDVEACTEADVVVFLAAGAVDRSVAEATLAWMLALSHHLRAKDALVREGRWDLRAQLMGREFRDRTLGLIGLGGIGKALVRLLEGFGMNPPLAYDPYLTPEAAAEVGARQVGLDELLASADFVSIHCPLTDETRGMIGAAQLARMKPDAFLINTARGGIVDEAALYEALKNGQIAGAAVDTFCQEPYPGPHPLGELDNVLLAPHSICWTDELFRDIGRAVCRGMLDLSLGKRPNGVVNPEVFDRPGFQSKWARLRCR
ncbi:MAG: NAD(P)-dependent oxidoreductase [Planctomycetota bacterium]